MRAAVVAAFALARLGRADGHSLSVLSGAKLSPVHREALKDREDNQTALTNVFTGRPAREAFVNRIVREVGPMSELAPEFPLAAGAIAPLRLKSEDTGSGGFCPAVVGTGGAIESPNFRLAELTRRLAEEALTKFSSGTLSPYGRRPTILRYSSSRECPTGFGGDVSLAPTM